MADINGRKEIKVSHRGYSETCLKILETTDHRAALFIKTLFSKRGGFLSPDDVVFLHRFSVRDYRCCKYIVHTDLCLQNLPNLKY